MASFSNLISVAFASHISLAVSHRSLRLSAMSHSCFNSACLAAAFEPLVHHASAQFIHPQITQRRQRVIERRRARPSSLSRQRHDPHLSRERRSPSPLDSASPPRSSSPRTTTASPSGRSRARLRRVLRRPLLLHRDVIQLFTDGQRRQRTRSDRKRAHASRERRRAPGLLRSGVPSHRPRARRRPFRRDAHRERRENDDDERPHRAHRSTASLASRRRAPWRVRCRSLKSNRARSMTRRLFSPRLSSSRARLAMDRRSTPSPILAPRSPTVDVSRASIDRARARARSNESTTHTKKTTSHDSKLTPTHARAHTSRDVDARDGRRHTRARTSRRADTRCASERARSSTTASSRPSARATRDDDGRRDRRRDDAAAPRRARRRRRSSRASSAWSTSGAGVRREIGSGAWRSRTRAREGTRGGGRCTSGDDRGCVAGVENLKNAAAKTRDAGILCTGTRGREGTDE